MNAEYGFVENDYKLERMLKTENLALKNQIYSELEEERIEQVSESHFSYEDVHFSFDVDGTDVKTAVYGESNQVEEIENLFDEILDDFNDSILSSQKLQH